MSGGTAAHLHLSAAFVDPQIEKDRKPVIVKFHDVAWAQSLKIHVVQSSATVVQ
jgi:hypothetical protein